MDSLQFQASGDDVSPPKDALSCDLPDEYLLSRADVKQMGIDVSNSTLLRWESRKRFPRRLRLGGTKVAWLRSEVLQWVQDRAAERSRHYYGDI